MFIYVHVCFEPHLTGTRDKLKAFVQKHFLDFFIYLNSYPSILKEDFLYTENKSSCEKIGTEDHLAGKGKRDLLDFSIF